MQLTFRLWTTADYWSIRTVKMRNECMEWDFWVYYYLQLADSLKSILQNILYVSFKNNGLMNEKVHEDGKMAAKIPITLCWATIHDNILWIRRWHNQCQHSVKDVASCIMGDLSGNLLWRFIHEVMAGIIGKKESDTLPAPFGYWAWTVRHQMWILNTRKFNCDLIVTIYDGTIGLLYRKIW